MKPVLVVAGTMARDRGGMQGSIWNSEAAASVGGRRALRPALDRTGIRPLRGRMKVMVARRRSFPWLLCLCLLALLRAGEAGAALQPYRASWEASRWQLDTAPRQCVLSHPIPHLGSVRFEQRPGHGLRFTLHVDQPQPGERTARLYVQPPPWRHQGAGRSLGEAALQRGKVPLQLGNAQSLAFFHELEQGMQAVIAFSGAGPAEETQITVQPVRFREVLPAFLACTAKLMYLDFEPLAEHRIHFATNSVRLSRAARRVLEQVVRDYRKRGKMRIVLGGHADARGKPEYNMALSRRRATMVSRYLRSRGVPAGAIEVRYFGDTRPRKPGNDPRAWSENRRVTVWLTADPKPAGRLRVAAARR